MRKHPVEEYIYQEAKDKALCEPVSLSLPKSDIICVCAYCEEMKEITELILNAGDLPSHWIYDEHYKEEMEKLEESFGDNHLNWIA